ncbi:hypothetical protein PRK78_006568 [Emydomyces testavorans]|uniref:Uncharacterized protein n=1 Tax=Emydomyces testavorans TaxID=2070801 RepID=A0AAF0INQ8_9EURO|nr:hypothetical protein PRK78_006568 [Emydomyces testavorans]
MKMSHYTRATAAAPFPAVLLSIETDTELEDFPEDQELQTSEVQGQSAPHFRNIFKDGMAQHAQDAWLSSLNGKEQWNRLISRVAREEKTNYLHLNICLKGIDGGIDAIKKMNEYHDLVILQSGISKLILDAFSKLLISSFYFVLAHCPVQEQRGLFFCCDTIHCEPSIQLILPLIQELQELEPMYFVTDHKALSRFLGNDDICILCGRYFKHIKFNMKCLDEPVSIYLKFKRHQQLRISGFVDSMNGFIKNQGLNFSFGSAHHDQPGTKHCNLCNSIPSVPSCRKQTAENELRRALKKPKH